MGDSYDDSYDDSYSDSDYDNDYDSSVPNYDTEDTDYEDEDSLQPLSDSYDYSVVDSYAVQPDQMNEMIDLRSSNRLVEDNTRRRSIPRNSYGDRINRL